MSAFITGGEPTKKIVQVSEDDMRAIQALKAAGFGSGEGNAPAPAGGYNAIVNMRRKSGVSAGARYQQWASGLRDAVASGDPRAVKAWKDANAPFVRAALLGATDVHHNSTMMSLSVQYANDEYIGLGLCPAVPTTKKSDTYYTYDKRSRLNTPTNDEVGDYGDAVEVEDARADATYVCVPRATKRRLAATVLSNQDAPLDEMLDLGESVAEHRELRREQRIATVMTTAGNFPTGNKATLSGADQWNSASGGNPIAKLQAADAALWRGRGVAKTKAYSSLDVYHVLSRHPDILGLFQYGGSSVGLATPDMIAKFLGWDEYLVGRARQDTADEGATASYGRIWGNYFGVVRVMERASLRNAAFAATIRWTLPGVAGSSGGIVTKQWFDPKQGLGGSHWVEQGEAEDHKVIASDTGFLYTDPIA